MLQIAQIDLAEVLQTTFPELGEEDIRALLYAAVPRCYPAGAIVCREGEPGTSLFILLEGAADIIVHASPEIDILIDTVGPNTYLGEMAFLGETTRTATICARSDCQMLVIEHTDFLPVAHANPRLLRTLLRQIIGHLRRNDEAVIQELNIKNAALEKAYLDLAAQEKLRTEFIATLSHELRTPLTTIKGFLGLINQGAVKGESVQVALNAITRNVDTMVGLTNDLLILYEMHPATAEYSYVSLPDILIEALNAAREVLNGKTTRVTLDIAAEISTVYADRRSLVLALRAIIENSFKFNPDQKPIHIAADNRAAREVVISVRDEGIGIARENLSRIFEPFVRIEQEGGQHLFPGLGVGLTIARFVVERQNGRIEVESAPGQGSTFTIVLSQPNPPE
ncbi:MAG: HAMP domain-containing histidine kinase [Chloroflexi bacterium]|nr:HAMP domain-containing histidine kinase [Chloroflexota bacterium]